MEQKLTAEIAREIYRYDGHNLWNKRRGHGIRYKLPVGCKTRLGYLVTRYMGHQYKVHRIIWLMVYGEWPNGVIDHINGCASDNRLENLRDVTHSENSRNRSPDSGTPVVGVFMTGNKYEARISNNGERVYLGIFPSLNEAKNAREKAEVKYWGRRTKDLRNLPKREEARGCLSNGEKR